MSEFKKAFKNADGELRKALRDRRCFFYNGESHKYLKLGEWFLPQLEENYGPEIFDAVWETRGRDYDYNPEMDVIRKRNKQPKGIEQWTCKT